MLASLVGSSVLAGSNHVENLLRWLKIAQCTSILGNHRMTSVGIVMVEAILNRMYVEPAVSTVGDDFVRGY